MPKKILHIIIKSRYDGVTAYSVRLIKYLPQYDHSILSCYSGNAYNEIIENKIRCKNLLSSEKISFRSLLYKYIKTILFLLKNKFDIIHYHHGGIGVLLLALLFSKNAKIIHHLHGGNLIGDNKKQDISTIHFYLLKYLAVRTYQIAIAEHVYNEYKTKIKTINNLVVIKNSVPNEFQKKELKTNSIGYIGRFSKEKGFDLFISVASKLKSSQPGLKIVAMGEKMDHKETFIKIVPPSFNIDQFYFDVDLILFTSVAPEGLPLVVLEAISFDVGVIAYPLKGVIEILGKDYPLYFTNTDELFSKIEYFYSQDFNRPRLTELHLQRINNFKFSEMIRKIDSLYNFLS